MTPSQKKITDGYKAIYEGTQSGRSMSAKFLRRHARVRLEDRAGELIRDGLPDEAIARAVGLPIANIRSVRERRGHA